MLTQNYRLKYIFLFFLASFKLYASELSEDEQGVRWQTSVAHLGVSELESTLVFLATKEREAYEAVYNLKKKHSRELGFNLFTGAFHLAVKTPTSSEETWLPPFYLKTNKTTDTNPVFCISREHFFEEYEDLKKSGLNIRGLNHKDEAKKKIQDRVVALQDAIALFNTQFSRAFLEEIETQTTEEGEDSEPEPAGTSSDSPEDLKKIIDNFVLNFHNKYRPDEFDKRTSTQTAAVIKSA